MNNVFIISGPAGSGKDTIIDTLGLSLPIERIITTTTRAMRPGEHTGNPYYFLTRSQFEAGITAGDFVEYSTNENGQLYGVTRSELERIARKGTLALWRVDWKGVIAIKRLYPDIPALYISAPLDLLEERLRARDQDKDESYFKERMDYTREWLNHLSLYDYQVENEQGKLDEAVATVKAIIVSHFGK